MNHITNGLLFTLGTIIALIAIALAAAIVYATAKWLRYTRLGWWIWRHWPTPRRP